MDPKEGPYFRVMVCVSIPHKGMKLGPFGEASWQRRWRALTPRLGTGA